MSIDDTKICFSFRFLGWSVWQTNSLLEKFPGDARQILLPGFFLLKYNWNIPLYQLPMYNTMVRTYLSHNWKFVIFDHFPKVKTQGELILKKFIFTVSCSVSSHFPPVSGSVFYLLLRGTLSDTEGSTVVPPLQVSSFSGWITFVLSFKSFSFSVQFGSVAQSCLTLCDPMGCSTPGFPVHHQLLELAQTHVHPVGDAIQPSHPLSSPSPPAFNLSQHQGWSFLISQFFLSGG